MAVITDTLLGTGPMLWPKPVIDSENNTGLMRQAATDTGDVQAINTFSVYPNPSTGTLTLNATATGTFYLYTMLGQQAGEYVVTVGQTTVTLPANLSAGVYMGTYRPDNNASPSEVRIVLDR
jgi:hypothetical protein